MNANIQGDFQICNSVPLNVLKILKWNSALKYPEKK